MAATKFAATVAVTVAVTGSHDLAATVEVTVAVTGSHELPMPVAATGCHGLAAAQAGLSRTFLLFTSSRVKSLTERINSCQSVKSTSTNQKSFNRKSHCNP